MDRGFVLGLARDWGIALVLTVGLFATWSCFMGGGGVASGEDAPPFTLSDEVGQPVSLQELQGQVVVLNFWATWCGPCREEIPDFARFAENHPDVPVLGVSTDADKPSKLVWALGRKFGINYPILHDVDGAVAALYGVDTLPTTYVIGADGHIVTRQVGTISEARLEKLLAAAQTHGGD